MQVIFFNKSTFFIQRWSAQPPLSPWSASSSCSSALSSVTSDTFGLTTPYWPSLLESSSCSQVLFAFLLLDVLRIVLLHHSVLLSLCQDFLWWWVSYFTSPASMTRCWIEIKVMRSIAATNTAGPLRLLLSPSYWPRYMSALLLCSFLDDFPLIGIKIVLSKAPQWKQDYLMSWLFHGLSCIIELRDE